MPQAADFYAVLGVPRTADEREIKKAYFRLVRQCPPETHPEEFKRIREAYEILGSPAARKEYDSVTQYGEEIGLHLRAGMEAMDRGDLRAAQGEFKRVLAIQPDLHFARDLLGMSLLNDSQPREALRQFEQVLSTEESNATYHLHKGYAHSALDEYQEALGAYRRAREKDETDTRILVALADCYTAMDRYEEALGELDRAINMDGEVDFQDFVFFMRKVQIQLLRDRTDLAEQEIDRIFAILPEDAEVKKYVAQKLAGLASQLFRIKRSADANRLLRRAQQLDHSRKPLVFPSRATQRLRDLPPPSREQLSQLAQEPSPYKLQHGVWAGPVLLALGAAVVLLGALWSAATSRHTWHGNQLGVMSLLLLLGPALALLAAQRLRRVAQSKVGRFTTIHPLYLLQVDVDRVTAWPLVNLHDVSMTHHLQNGVYQYTAVKADFAGVNLMLTIRGQQAAVDWAQALLDARHRCLGLLAVGMLEEEEGHDILPPEMLQGKLPQGAAGTGAFLKQYAAAAAAGVVLVGAGVSLNRGAAERHAWRQATSYPRAYGMRSYLERYPGGEHVAEARQALGRIYDEAKEHYLRQVGDPPGKRAILDVLETLKEAPSQDVLVRYTSRVNMSAVEGQRLSDGTMPIQPTRAFAAEVNRRREHAITENLSGAFHKVLTRDVLALNGVEQRSYGARHAPAVVFDVDYSVTPSGELYRSTTDRSALYGIELSWTLKIKTPRSGDRPYTMHLVSRPAQSIHYMKSTYEDDEILPYTKMAESAFEEFGRKVAAEFGVTIPAPPPRAAELGRGVMSPEVRRRLHDLARRRNMSPEELEDLISRRRGGADQRMSRPSRHGAAQDAAQQPPARPPAP